MYYFQNRFHLFIVHVSFFYFASGLFAEIDFFAMQITKGKFKFRKIENMQLYRCRVYFDRIVLRVVFFNKRIKSFSNFHVLLILTPKYSTKLK